MRLMIRFALVLGLAQIPGGALAADRLACLKTTCQEKASSCLSAVFAAQDPCFKAARQGCDKVELGQKAACVTAATQACGKSRNAANDACRASLATCAAACGPNDANAHQYWCTGEIGDGLKSGFCGLDADKSGRDLINLCRKQLFLKETGDFTQECTPI